MISLYSFGQDDRHMSTEGCTGMAAPEDATSQEARLEGKRPDAEVRATRDATECDNQQSLFDDGRNSNNRCTGSRQSSLHQPRQKQQPQQQQQKGEAAKSAVCDKEAHSSTNAICGSHASSEVNDEQSQNTTTCSSSSGGMDEEERAEAEAEARMQSIGKAYAEARRKGITAAARLMKEARLLRAIALG
eukprot:1082405-Pleurochrysis_carterae.AAC.7